MQSTRTVYVTGPRMRKMRCEVFMFWRNQPVRMVALRVAGISWVCG
jgi:hypothetical protein